MLVEIKARFDEHANIRWARKLEQAGCHVVYGLVGLKTHCKLAMVVRDEPEGIRRYVHIGTGNYNPKTARHVRGLRAADRARGDRRGRRAPVQQPVRVLAQRVLRAPAGGPGLRARRASSSGSARRSSTTEAGRPARIRIKANSIVDEAVIDELYRASQAGVPVDLLTRGICALRPGVAGPVRDDPGALDPGPVPRAQPGVLVRERRRPGGVDRVGRPDAPQPRPAGRVPGASCPARRRSTRSPGCSTWPSTTVRRRGGSTADGSGSATTSTPTASRCATCRRC